MCNGNYLGIGMQQLKQENDFNQKALREFRRTRRESQSLFWSRFGVTQSRGSRFEMGTEIPPPVAILLKLYLDGVITDNDL
jgi:hypothetical protein